MDSHDKNIILMLDHDGRIAHSTIGKKLGISKDTVAYRIRKLESQGIITGYHAVIDYAKLGYLNCKIYLKLDRVNNELMQTIVQNLRKSRKASWIMNVADDYDLVVSTLEKNIKDFHDTYRDICLDLSKHVTKKKSAITTRIHHFDSNFLFEHSPELLYTTGMQGDERLTSSEYKLLDALRKKGNIAIIDAAKECSAKPTTLLYSLRQLKQKGVILGFRPSINYAALGFDRYKVMLTLRCNESADHGRIMRAINNIVGVIFITELIADHDVEFEVLCKNKMELVNTIDALRTKHSVIQNVHTRLLIKEHSINYLPDILSR